ncbi:hypothetical protein QQ045_015893 [Rhodiola kirilowii]
MPNTSTFNHHLIDFFDFTLESRQERHFYDVIEICICTNYTEPCTAFLASQDEFKSAPDPKALAPFVNCDQNEKIKDEKLKRLYDGCAKLYDFSGAEVYSALENAKSTSEAIAKELLEESRIFGDDCVAGPKELNVTDSSHLPHGNEMLTTKIFETYHNSNKKLRFMSRSERERLDLSMTILLDLDLTPKC